MKNKNEPVAWRKTTREFHEYHGSSKQDDGGYLTTRYNNTKPHFSDGWEPLYDHPAPPAGQPPVAQPVPTCEPVPGHAQTCSLGTKSCIVVHSVADAHFDEVIASTETASRSTKPTAPVAQEPVGSVLPSILKNQDGEWCREALIYSPNSPHDYPEKRVKLYLAPPTPAQGLSDAEVDILRKALACIRWLTFGEKDEHGYYPKVSDTLASINTILSANRAAQEN